MKKFLLTVCLSLMLVVPALAFPPVPVHHYSTTTPETVTCVADAGVASVSIKVTRIVTDNTDTDEDTITLADGIAGDEKVFIYMTETDAGDSANITPEHLAGGSKIKFDVPGQGCVMLFDGTNWSIVANNGGAIS